MRGKINGRPRRIWLIDSLIESIGSACAALAPKAEIRAADPQLHRNLALLEHERRERQRALFGGPKDYAVERAVGVLPDATRFLTAAEKRAGRWLRNNPGATPPAHIQRMIAEVGYARLIGRQEAESAPAP